MQIWGGRPGAGQGGQGGRQVASVLDNMDVLPDGPEFVRLDGGQASADDDDLRIFFLGLVEQVSALGRGGVRDATCIDDNKLRRLGKIDKLQAEAFEKLANLLSFVLVDFAAKCVYGKSVHDVI